MVARIFMPAKTAMQSGLARTKKWMLVFEPSAPRGVEPLMGWTSARDMRREVMLEFSTKDEAIAYAEKLGLAYEILEPKIRKPRPKAYADNFHHNRRDRWTH